MFAPAVFTGARLAGSNVAIWLACLDQIGAGGAFGNLGLNGLIETAAEFGGGVGAAKIEERPDEGDGLAAVFIGVENRLGSGGADSGIQQFGERSVQSEQFHGLVRGQVDLHVLGIGETEFGQLIGDLNQISGGNEGRRIAGLEGIFRGVVPADGGIQVGRKLPAVAENRADGGVVCAEGDGLALQKGVVLRAGFSQGGREVGMLRADRQPADVMKQAEGGNESAVDIGHA